MVKIYSIVQSQIFHIIIDSALKEIHNNSHLKMFYKVTFTGD